MANSRIVNNLGAMCLAAALLAGCSLFHKDAAVDMSVPEAARSAMYDSSSVNYVHFDHYGLSKYMPIGVFDADSTSMTLLETCLKLDCFNNITGERVSDGIPDFAGEYFQYYTARSDDECFKSALFLMQDHYWDSFEKERSKIILAGGSLIPSKGLNEIEAVSDLNEAGVKVISEVNSGIRAMFDSLEVNDISSLTVAALCDSTDNDVAAYSEAIRKIAAERGNDRTISIIRGENTLEGLERTVDNLRRSSTKSPLKVIVMDGESAEFVASCEAVLERYRNMFVNGTYPYRSILADDIIFIDPSLSAAVECYLTLRKDKNLALRAEKQKVYYFYGI